MKIQSIYNKCRKLYNMKFQSSSWPKRSLEKLRSVFAPSFFFIKIMVANWNHSILKGVGTSYGSDLSSAVWKKMLMSLFEKSALFIHCLAKNCLENKWNCQVGDISSLDAVIGFSFSLLNFWKKSSLRKVSCLQGV